MKQKGGGDYHIFVIYIQVSLCCFIYSTYCFVVFLVNSNNGLTYGSILSGRWNTLFGSFILVYCKACSSWTKICTRHFFFEILQSKVVPVCKKIRLFFFSSHKIVQNRFCQWVLKLENMDVLRHNRKWYL